MSIESGTLLNHYRIIAKLGEGGMGQVYRAQDTKLKRDIAIKVLPEDLAEDPDRLARFQREAELLAAVTHPNIAAIHSIEETETGTGRRVRFLVLELVEGETLAERLADGPVRFEEALEVCDRVAAALEAAHERGIVHRDLKPANVMITPRGEIKVLDFGIAKEVRPPVAAAADGDSLTEMRTSAPQLTAAGTLVGTTQYMSPEQVRGQEIDERTDVWALGCVLFEALTGEVAFPGPTVPDVLAAVLQQEPVWEALPDDVPDAVRSTLRKALQKNLKERHGDISELRNDLRNEIEEALAAGPERSRPSRAPWAEPGTKRRVAWVTAAAVGVVVAIIGAIVVAGIGGVGFVGWGGDGAGSEQRITSLAVLPFVNVSGDPDREYFAAGMTEELITSLGQISSLRVISRTSVMQYKDAPKPLPEVSEELGVNGVVEASVFPGDEQVRVTVRLFHAPTDTLVWTQTYERDAGDILALYGDVALAIAEEIELSLVPGEEERLTVLRTVDPEAYRLYLQGMFQLNSARLEPATRYFEQALAIDDQYAPIYSGLAWTHAMQSYWTSELNPIEALSLSLPAAERALQLDDQLAESYAAMGFIKHVLEWDWAAAEDAYERALQLSPTTGAGFMRNSFSLYLINMGRFDEAIAVEERNLEINPLDPFPIVNLGYALMLAGRLDEAIERFERGIELHPDFPALLSSFGQVRILQGEPEEAVRILEREAAEDTVALAVAYVAAGRRAEAISILRELEMEASPGGAGAYYAAAVNAALGNTEAALEWLQRAYEQRDSNLVWLKVDWMLEDLRGEPDFQDLLRRMAFPE